MKRVPIEQSPVVIKPPTVKSKSPITPVSITLQGIRRMGYVMGLDSDDFSKPKRKASQR
jgi:hypothetical protein